ncbi:hypothetical protein [Nocardioides panacisoli]|uniref:Uncharacterized protein n=1 Tax=Nocardioides panacisoli TaxID=627624 RepID=A0ABP7HVK7_9ACTN
MSDDLASPGVQKILINPPEQAAPEPRRVVKWRRRGMVLEGLVTHEVDGREVTEWLPALDFEPGATALVPQAETDS